MTALHQYLGITVVALNLGAAVYGLVPGLGRDRFARIAALAHGSLAIQVVTGFFLTTSAAGPGTGHTVFPALALAAVIGARSVRGDKRVRMIALASLLVVAAGVYSYLTGISRVS